MVPYEQADNRAARSAAMLILRRTNAKHLCEPRGAGAASCSRALRAGGRGGGEDGPSPGEAAVHSLPQSPDKHVLSVYLMPKAKDENIDLRKAELLPRG